MPKQRTSYRKRLFIKAIERGTSVIIAAQAAGIDRTLPYKWEQEDPNFAKDWDLARDRKIPQVIDTAFDIALEGNQKMIKFLIDRNDRKGPTDQRQVDTIRIILPGEDAQPDENADFFS